MATVTITHTRRDGTLLEGSVRGDGVFDVVRHLGFRSFRSLGMLGIRHSRDKAANTWVIEQARKALEEAGHTVTVDIDDSVRRTFAEAEADRSERAADREERFGGYAGNAAASSEARREAADRISKRFEFGQPILIGHHSERRARRDAERIDTNMRKSFEDSDRAAYWQNRSEAAGHYDEYRNDPQRTRRRLEKLRADLRSMERHHAKAVENGWDAAGRYANDIQDLKEQIAYWEEVVEKAKAAGVKMWGPDDFAPGDFVMYLGSWYEVVRVNPKTLSVAWNLRLAPKQVMSAEDATFGDRVSTHSADYTNARARCPGDAMRAFLADGKVPGTKSAAAASAEAPAEDIRRAQAEMKKARKKTPKKRSDPKVPKRVQIECEAGAGEAMLTWLNGSSRPYPDRQPETITAPEGEKYQRGTWSWTLRKQVAELLAERGYALVGEWKPRQGWTAVAAIEPAPRADTRPAPDAQAEPPEPDAPAEPAGPEAPPEPAEPVLSAEGEPAGLFEVSALGGTGCGQ